MVFRIKKKFRLCSNPLSLKSNQNRHEKLKAGNLSIDEKNIYFRGHCGYHIVALFYFLKRRKWLRFQQLG